jgi:hypothetical protein
MIQRKDFGLTMEFCVATGSARLVRKILLTAPKTSRDGEADTNVRWVIVGEEYPDEAVQAAEKEAAAELRRMMLDG